MLEALVMMVMLVDGNVHELDAGDDGNILSAGN